MTKVQRTSLLTCLLTLLALGLPGWAQAQTDQTREAPLPAPAADGVAIFGELVSIGPDSLVLRETKYVYAANAQPGSEPTPVVTERVILIPAGTPITSQSPDGLQPGTRLLVGARETDGVLTAVMITDESALLRGGKAVDPETVKAELGPRLVRALDEALVKDPAPNAGLPDCLIAQNGFTPGPNVLNFTGCYGGPSLTARASFSVKIFANGIPDSMIFPETFSISVTGFELNLGLAGWNYQFPFKFSAVDPAQVALDKWARECLATYGTVAAGGCPLARPYVPGPGQPRNIDVNVTPVDPSPAPIMNGGLGGTIGFEFTLFYATGCGSARLDPCYFKHWVDFGPFSQFQRASGPAPLGVGKVLRGEASGCLSVGISLILGKKLPVGISTLVSPFDVLYCQPWEIYNNSQPGFSARVSDSNGGTVTDVAGEANPRVTFFGPPRTVRVTPKTQGTTSIRFQQFDYRLDWLTKLRLDLRSSLVTWFRGPEWNTGITPGMKFVNTISPYIDTCGSTIVHQLDAPGFTGLQPVCIDIDIPQAEFGDATVSALNPVAVSSEGGTKVKVTGTGFRPTTKSDGSKYPGTGVTRIVLHRADTNTEQDVTFSVRSDTEIDLVMPAHPPSLVVDANGAFDHGSPVILTFYAWGTTFNKYIYYAAQPTIGSITALDAAFAPEGTSPTGSEMGGERVALIGRYIGKVTDVYFGDKKAEFVECHAGQTSPLCQGAPGGLGLYNAIVAIAPPSTGALADCPAGQGTRCDYVRVRSACFGNDFAQGRPAPGAYCGMSVATIDAVYVRKKKPEITSVTPGGGLPGAAMQVTLTGVGFSGYPKVKIANVLGAQICNAPGCPSWSDTQLVVTVPAADIGASMISVVNPCPAAQATSTRCGESDPVSFKHLDTPLLTALSPSQGTYAGGTVVTLTGQGFTTATSVTFAGAPVAFTLDATSPDTKLTFTTPLGYPNLVPGLPGSVSVSVTTGCGTVALTNAMSCGSSAPLTYTYLPPAVRLDATLRVAQITGEVGKSAPLSATLTDSSTGAVLPNRTVSFSVLGVTLGSAVTNASGVASFSAVMPDVLTGAYAEQTVATFAGDAVYAAKTDVNWLILTKPEVVAWGNPMYAYYKDVPALLSGITAISAGGNHTLALKSDGTVVSWGNAIYDIAPPAGLSGVTAISAGYSHSLALKSNGTVVKWGIGGGTLPSLPSIQKISAGSNLSIAVTTSGSLVAWAVSGTNPALSGIPTAGSDPFIAAAAGQSHGLALRQSGTVVAWGDNTYGQSTVPAGLTNVVAVAAAFNGSIALKSDGTVVGWGYPQAHTVCPPFPCTTVTESYFKPPAGLTGVTAIAASPDGVGGIALRSDKTVVAWYHGGLRNLNAPAGYDAGVESVAAGGESGAVFYVALRRARLGTTLKVDPVTGFAGDAVTLRGVLLTGTSGASDRDVTFSLNGVTAGTGSRTDGNGVTTKSATIPAIAPGLYPTGVQANFPTPALGLDGSSASAQLLVRGNQTITFGALSDRPFTPAPFTVSASASSSLPVTFASSGSCLVAGDQVTLTGPGSCSITASQAGTQVYTAAASVTRTFDVSRALQTLSFAPLPDVTFGASPATAVVEASSGLPVVLTSLTPSVCAAVGFRVTNLSVGACSIAADQPGNANYSPADRITRTFSITLDAFDLSKVPSQLDPPSASIVSGTSHSCTLLVSGGVKCWGSNASGQLGDGSTTRRLTPVDVSGLGSTVTELAAGGNHTCAILTDGSVKCWGSNEDGELGNSSVVASSTPVSVSGLSGVVALAAGVSHTCALTTAGRVKCWGRNASGQLGDASTSARLVPVEVAGTGDAVALTGVIGVAAGDAHTCAVTAAGGVVCWGANAHGQLGNGSTDAKSRPVDVLGTAGTGVLASAVRVVAGGNISCAISDAGVPTCWGLNDSGQLGDGTTTSSTAPVTVSSVPRGVSFMAAGGGHACAVNPAGGVLCWGGNASGQLGDGSRTSRTTPVPAIGVAYGVLKVSGGASHTCALTTTGGVKCWGSNSEGQLGNNSTDSQLRFADVAGLSAGAAAVTLGPAHSCAITAGGGVRCWGNNDVGQLGDGTLLNRLAPAPVPGLGSGVVALASGLAHTCALTQTGGVKCWGWNSSGGLGDGSNVNRSAPVDVIGLGAGVARISAGDFHTCALLTTGGVKCWGSNNLGQLGDLTHSDRNTPVDVAASVSGAVSLAAGSYHNCVLTAGGAVKCWGNNVSGQLGVADRLESPSPVDVTGMGSGVLGLGAGGDHTCALLDQGITKCWGSNANGELGDGTLVQSSTPVALDPQVEGASALALSSGNTCLLGAFGQVACWGGNSHGQLGDGTTLSRPSPTAMVEGFSNGGALSGASERHCAIDSAGGLKCWGRNHIGQIGDGSTSDRLTPVNVRGGQSIYLETPSALRRGAQATLAAVATSGLPVSYVSLSPGVCSVDGSTVSGVNAGLCAIRAAQPGDGSWAAAPQQTRLMQITLARFQVTPSAGTNGSISPSSPVEVVEGATTQFTVTPASGYTPVVGGTCGGTLSGTTFTTAAISANCTVSVTFAAVAISVGDVTVSEGDSGVTNATFTVTLSRASALTVTVSAATEENTATSGSDFTATGPTTLTFSPGSTSRTFTVPIQGDVLDEADETLLVNLTSATNASISDSSGLGTITDDDATPTLSIGNAETTEGDSDRSPMTFTVTLSAASGRPVTVRYATSDGTATAGADYMANSGMLSFAPGETTQTIDVSVTGDVLDEANETFTVTLASATNAIIATGGGSGTGTITDDDATPTLSIGNATVTEGNSGTSTMTFTVTLSTASSASVTVGYATSGGTALAGVDYTSTSGTLTFAAGETTKTISVSVIGDVLDEADETLTVTLASATNATIAAGAGSGTGTITDDDATPTLSIGNATVTEGNSGTSTMTFTVSLSAASGRSVTVGYSTSDGTATAGVDYTSASGTLTFAPGDTTKTVAVSVTGDVLDEADETLTVSMASATNATIATGAGSGTGTITDDDATPTLSIGNATVTEGNSGTSTMTFTVTLSAASGRPVTVQYATSDGTATAGADYVAASGSLTFAVGELSKTIVVRAVGDVLSEPDETFGLALSNPVNATINAGAATGTIQDDDDGASALSINDVVVTEGNIGTVAARFTVSLTPPMKSTVTVDYSTSGETAESGSDFAPSAGRLSFAPGETAKTITVLVKGDLAAEPDESFLVSLVNPVNAMAARGTGRGAILNDDDALPTIAVGNASVKEGDRGLTPLKFTLTLSQANANPVTVTYSTVDGTAISGSDYEAARGTLTLAPGQKAAEVAIMVNGDTAEESNEAFSLAITGATFARITQAIGHGTVVNDDATSAPQRPQASWQEFFAVDTLETPYVGDFNGDGKADVITFARQNPNALGDVYVALSDGVKFGANTKWHDFFAISTDESVIIGDFNGDGKDDIATWLGKSSREVYVALSTGSGMLSESAWVSSLGADPTDLIFAGDADGDGKDDLIAFARKQGKVYVAISEGTKFATPAVWHGFFAVSTYERPRVADVNGDGKADIVTFATDSPTAFGDVYVATSNGSQFVGPSGAANDSSKWHDFFAIRPTEEIRIGDLNGDGRDDFFTFLPPPFAQCYSVLSQGSSMADNALWAEAVAPLLGTGDNVYVGDVNGDGKADIIIFAQKEGKVFVSLAP